MAWTVSWFAMVGVRMAYVMPGMACVLKDAEIPEPEDRTVQWVSQKSFLYCLGEQYDMKWLLIVQRQEKMTFYSLELLNIDVQIESLWRLLNNNVPKD